MSQNAEDGQGLIIAGHIEVDAGRRDEYVAAFAEMVERARSAPGCLALAISADSVDPRRVNNFERWASRDSLDAWREVANPPKTGIAIEADSVDLFEISAVGDPFG